MLLEPYGFHPFSWEAFRPAAVLLAATSMNEPHSQPFRSGFCPAAFISLVVFSSARIQPSPERHCLEPLLVRVHHDHSFGEFGCRWRLHLLHIRMPFSFGMIERPNDFIVLSNSNAVIEKHSSPNGSGVSPIQQNAEKIKMRTP